MPAPLRQDRDDSARAPEEAAIESWIEDHSVYLTLPRADTMRPRVDRTSTAATSPVRGE